MISYCMMMVVGVDGLDGVYGFVGNGICSDFLLLNGGSGFVFGNLIDFFVLVGVLYVQDLNQNLCEFQLYLYYVMLGGFVELFIDVIGLCCGGMFVLMVKVNINGMLMVVDCVYGCVGFGGYGDILVNLLVMGVGYN